MSALLDRVEGSRALYRGYLLVGHRISLALGKMTWAIPGGGHATTHELRRAGFFEKLSGPNDAEIEAYATQNRKESK